MPTKILLVDDYEPNNAILKKKMQERKYVVETTNNVEKALAMSITFAPDLILMDLSMPGLTGWDFISEFKKRPSFVNIPVIAVSSTISDEDAEKIKNAGFSGYCLKPIKVKHFFSQLPKWIPVDPLDEEFDALEYE